MDLFMAGCVLYVAAYGSLYFLVLRSMFVHGGRTLFIISVLTGGSIVGTLLAFVLGWWNVRRWELKTAMWCWTGVIVAGIVPTFFKFRDEATGPLCAALPASIMAAWGCIRTYRQWQPMLDLEGAPSPETAAAVARSGDSAVPRLESLLGHDNQEVRLAALAALGQIGTPAARRALSHALTYGDPEIRNVAQLWLDRAAPESA